MKKFIPVTNQETDKNDSLFITKYSEAAQKEMLDWKTNNPGKILVETRFNGHKFFDNVGDVVKSDAPENYAFVFKEDFDNYNKFLLSIINGKEFYQIGQEGFELKILDSLEPHMLYIPDAKKFLFLNISDGSNNAKEQLDTLVKEFLAKENKPLESKYLFNFDKIPEVCTVTLKETRNFKYLLKLIDSETRITLIDPAGKRYINIPFNGIQSYLEDKKVVLPKDIDTVMIDEQLFLVKAKDRKYFK